MGKRNNANYKFTDSAIINDQTYFDYLDRFKRVALSMFEWVNLPKSMNARWLERCLYYNGQAALLKSDKYGFINTNCCSSGKVNIYGLPTILNCYSVGDFQETRNLYTGLNPIKKNQAKDTEEAILVLNNWEGIPTCKTMELFAMRLYEAERTCDVNIKAQKTPVLIVVDEKQRLLMENLYSQFDGNKPFIFGDSGQFNTDLLKCINTEAPFIADKVMKYKEQIWNEALEFLGINTLTTEKKERLISDEASANNELINLNLQSFLAPRLQACKEFNEKFGLTGTDKEISVKVRSDLYNIVKREMSITKELDPGYYNEEIKEEEDIKDGKI